MAKQTVNLGVIPNGVGGDDVRTGFTKVNENFTELYTTPSQAEAEAGASQVVKGWTAQRVRQGTTAWYAGISGAIGRKILGRSTAAQVRSDIGLGTAATANLTTSTIDTTAGRVSKVGDFGLGVDSHTAYSDFLLIPKFTGVYQTTSAPANAPENTGTTWTVFVSSIGATRAFMVAMGAGDGINPSRNNRLYYKWMNAGSWDSPWVEFLHTANTTKNPDGTLKASSPVINLYSDKHDLHNEGQFGATPAVVRKSKGVYEITGTLGLRSEGWYLDTPSDRNGNKYFNIEWTQNITPDTTDGVVEEYRDDIVVSIETFERVWNKDTGLFENGAPIDINDLQDRFVQLRFNEIKVEHEEVIDDLP